MANSKINVNVKNKKWTLVFDDQVSKIGKPFSKDEITTILNNNPDWRKDAKKKSYVYNCIKDRIKRGRIEDCGNGLYKWVGFKY